MITEVSNEMTKEETEKAETSLTSKVEQSSILSILTFISELRERRRNVTSTLDKLNAAGYGPRPWEFNMRTRFTGRYDVVKPGERAQALVVRRPLLEGTFASVDELHVHMQKALTFISSH
ncbi:unnamed protein product [Arctia plantaginis]|uniref:Uncharacterized protein n=1 Tax=Arctia plantaginis TaxID=874455 RepID=A0A8S0Z799_ARCPL|nr:unnamed protein product [Arctia plantaginis]